VAERRARRALAGSVVFLVVAPGTVAGWVPYWLAVVAIVLGQALVLGSAALLEYAALLWLLFHAFVLLYEEPNLRTRFGPSYEVYRRNVRRWWPRFRPWDG
jgi:protein-S-isoprenylcysteine O-methyltransferase Ste14